MAISKESIEQFLELGNYPDATKTYYLRVFDKCSDLEKKYSTNLYNFNENQIEETLKEFQASTSQAIETYGRIISKYIRWAISTDIRKPSIDVMSKSNINKSTATPFNVTLNNVSDLSKYGKLYKDGNVDMYIEFDHVDKIENSITVIDWSSFDIEEGDIFKASTNPLSSKDPQWFTQFATHDDMYFSEKTLRAYERNMENAQDMAIIRLLFEGVCGARAQDIRNLKKSDLLEDTNEIIIGDEKVKVKQRTMDLLIKASNEVIYVKKNGHITTEKTNIRRHTDLIDNKYVFRNSLTRTDGLHDPIGESVVYRRVKVISETLGIKNFKSKTIMRSGMIFYAKEIMERENTDTLTRYHYKEIAERFGVDTWHSIKKYCNEDSIKKLYH